ncbi:MAG: outer membrane beta-barrel protein [Gemmatimonadaceae bacterium]
MKIRTAVIVALVTLAPLGIGQAQISNPLKVTLFGGPAFPTGNTSDLVKTGFNVGGALDLKLPLIPVGFRGEVIYSSFDASDTRTTVATADASELGGNVNVVAWVPLPTAGLIRPYFTAGPSYSRLELTPTSGTGSTANRAGFNVGAGVQFSLIALGMRLDARYRRISTDNGSFSYVPVTVGVTF